MATSHVKLVIALSGKSGVGKDMYGGMLKSVFKEHNTSCETLAFADALRVTASHHYGIPMSEFLRRDRKDAAFSADVAAALRRPVFYDNDSCVLEVPGHAPVKTVKRATDMPTTPREALLILGNGNGVIEDGTWMRVAMERVTASKCDVVVITDMRYRHEMAAVRDLTRNEGIPAACIRIHPFTESEDTYFGAHTSEIDLDDSTGAFNLDVYPQEGPEGVINALTDMVYIATCTCNIPAMFAAAGMSTE